MNASRYFYSKSRIWILPVVILAAGFSSLNSQQAFAQADSRNGGPVAHASDNATAQSHTPKAVLNGEAKLVARLASSTPLHLVFGLTPPKLAEEEQFLKQLQDPKSPNFHKYLTAAQWNARFAPSAADEQKVVDWAETNGLKVTGRFPNRLIIDVDGTSENVERAFAIKMNSYKLAGKTEMSNDRDPVMPAQLAGVLHSVSGLNTIQQLHTPRGGVAAFNNENYVPGKQEFNSAKNHANGSKSLFDAALKKSEDARLQSSSVKKGLTPASGQQPAITDGFIDPTDIYSSYGYSFGALQNQGHCCNPTGNSSGSTPQTSIAIATAGAINGNDIVGFQSRYGYLAYDYTYYNIDGTYTCNNSPNLDDACVETTLDTEWAIATANSFGSYLDTSHVFIYQAVNSGLGTFTDMFNQMLNDGNARILSTSWSCGEFDCYDNNTMDTDHGIFNSMLGQGWTLLGDSDDQGATGDCQATDRVTYPASDPDMVAVGGTTLSLYSDGTFYSETGWQGNTYTGACAHNDGGSGGGCSTKFGAPGYQTNPFCGSSGRSVPDISLNAGAGQNVYYNGNWYAFGGTSIATPQTAGFMAQANSYLLALGNGPLGQANYMIYYFAHNPSYAQHYPYYDMTSGCNNNDITEANNLGYFCAVSGYDRVTGWGSFNALQLSWAINAYYLGDFAAPTVTFSGPAGVNPNSYTYFNTDQIVNWTVADNGSSGLPATGVAGFSQAWDTPIGDPTSETTHGTGNAFYNGPQFPNATSGYLSLAAAGEGCHYAAVDAWDNSGYTSGNQYFYWICYDITAPVTTASLSGTLSSGHYTSAVKVTLSGTDNLSGVVSTVYQVDGGPVTTYSAPFTISTLGVHKVVFHSVDKAGNVESTKVVSFKEAGDTTSTLSASPTTAPKGAAIAFTAKVIPTSGGTPTGSVQLKDGTTVVQTKALSSGTASFSITTLGVGTHAMTVTYVSDSTHGSSTSSAVSVLIKNATTTALSSSSTTAIQGTSVKFTATVTSTGGTPTGNVQFKDGSTVIGTVALASGKAVFSTSTLAVGTHSITAYYESDATHYHSTSPVGTETIKYATTTALTSSLNPAAHGKKVTFTATVTGGTTPTGSVQFKDGSTVIGTVTLASGKAAFSTTTLAVGTHSITAYYENDATHYHSTSPAVSEVIK